MNWFLKFSSTKKFWWVFGFIFILKLGIGLSVFFQSTIESDAKDYFDFAQLILRDGPFTLAQGEIEAFAPPGFPWLLALAKYLTGWTGTIVIINAFLSTATIWVVYKISEYILPKSWEVLPAIWAVFYIPYSFYIGKVLKESLLQFLVPFGIYLLFKLNNKFSISVLILLGFVFAYTIHTDERYLVFFPLYVLALIKKNDLQRSIKNGVLFIFCVVIFSSPWFIRNYEVYERPIFITERFQSPIDKLLRLNNRLNERNENLHNQRISVKDSLLAGYSPKVSSGKLKSVKQAIDHGLIPHDYDLLERFYYNSLGYWSPIRTSEILLGSGWKYKGSRTLTTNILYTLNYGLLLPFMLVAIYFVWSRKIRALQWLSMYLLTHFSLHVMLIFGSGRYRHPVDFIIIILAFYGLSSITKYMEWKGIDRILNYTNKLLNR